MEEDLLQEFLAESWENLAQLDREIVSLEKDPGNQELLASIFRAIHTIKGTSGFIGLPGLGRVAHATENVLGRMREGTLTASPAAISIVLEGVDRIKELLQGLETGGREPELDSGVILHKLNLLASLGAPVSEAPAAIPPAMPVPVSQNPDVVASTAGDEAAPSLPAAAGSVAAAPPAGEQSAPTPPVPAAAPSAPLDLEGEASPETKKSVADLSIRVNVDVVDRLMNLVGELVLTRNQLLQMVRGEDESKFAAPITHLNRVTTDLQEGVMKTRMQPIGNAWAKLPRLVRDLARVTGKQIDLSMTGAETELDRTVLDAIKDPLTHMVRNSADHGIEAAAVRRGRGKPETGVIKLHAFHEGGHVIITIQDDGAGINPQRVLKKALEQGLTTEFEAAALSEAEILKFIFRAGFSTAEQITSVSGRGVGMDVVKTEIERIGGTVDLQSTVGVGTIIRIKIPLTLAIISALVVSSGEQCFAIPQLGVVELVRLPAEEKRRRIERIHTNEVFRLRDRLLPLIHLDRVLQIDQGGDQPDADVNIVVVQVGEEQFGLIVDEVFDTQEIVVKPVGSLLKDIKVYQGTTILGDGRVIMILDIAGIAAQYGGLDTKTLAAEQERDAAVDQQESTSLLLFSSDEGQVLAVPLALVSRLEEFPQRQIERSGDRQVVQYRGSLLPLVPLAGARDSGARRDPQPVVVFTEGPQSLGLMVDQILDIIDEPLAIGIASQRPGVLGTAIISGRATDVVDTQHYLGLANPNWFKRDLAQVKRRLLVVDDSLFFRQLVRTACEADGYKVHAVDSAPKAIECLERGEKFDAILSDIEMPGMDGLAFAEWRRQRPELLQTPLIAITSLDSDVYGQRILAAGFDRLLMKFNPQQLSATLKEFWTQRLPLRGMSA